MTDVFTIGLLIPLLMLIISPLSLYWTIRKAAAGGIKDYAQKRGDRRGIGRSQTNLNCNAPS